MAPKGRPKGFHPAAIAADDALSALHRMGSCSDVDTGKLQQRSEKLCSLMCERKQKYRADDVEIEAKRRQRDSNAALETLAQLAGIHLPSSSTKATGPVQ